MKSSTLPSFWEEYHSLPLEIRRAARKAYHLWSNNLFHPSLHFKCINRDEEIWSVRITRNYRAIGILQGDEITWFWIVIHDNYEVFFG